MITRLTGLVLPDELALAFAADPELFSPDRYHPSSAGYARIAEVLTPYVLAAARETRGTLRPEHGARFGYSSGEENNVPNVAGVP